MCCMHLFPSFRGPLWYNNSQKKKAKFGSPLIILSTPINTLQQRKDIIHTAGHVNLADIQWISVKEKYGYYLLLVLRIADERGVQGNCWALRVDFKEVSLKVFLLGLSDLPFKILSPSLSIAACDHADMVSTQ